MPKSYAITTPIYYVNSVPHIGTALTTIVSDVVARHHRMKGEHVFFLTGTDENALKVMEAAQAAGRPTAEFVDEIADRFRVIWDGLGISYDDFIRTTEPRHRDVVQEFFRVLQAKGYITTGTYEGWYDVSSETFYKESDLVDGKSPDGNDVRWVKEDNYFFRLSEFAEPLQAHIEAHPEFIQPEARRNEVLGFIKQGLRDACISRQNFGWGIPVPGDERQVIYVWFDALINYVAASGWPNPGWEEKWPADVQFMGKDILTRFHATLWPAMLMAVGLPLPTTLFGHAWMLTADESDNATKMSKSKGNVVAPLELAAALSERSGCGPAVAIDAVRYYVCASLPYENDTVFSLRDFDRRYNSDLANDLGNALNRSLAMAHKFTAGTVPGGEAEAEAQQAIDQAVASYGTAMAGFRVDQAAECAWGVVRFLNKYIDTRAPWALAKNHDPSLPGVIRSMLLGLRTAEGLIRPILPATADAIAAQLGLEPLTDWNLIGTEVSLPAGTALQAPQPIFPRLELPKEVQGTKPAPAERPAKAPKVPEAVTPRNETADPDALIGIEDFVKVKLKVGRVLDAEPVEGSDKLLKLQVMIGEEKRQIVAGIRKNYEPLDLIGRQVIVVVNLKPAKLRGVESQGMLLAATDEEGGAILLQPDRDAPEGTGVK